MLIYVESVSLSFLRPGIAKAFRFRGLAPRYTDFRNIRQCNFKTLWQATMYNVQQMDAKWKENRWFCYAVWTVMLGTFPHVCLDLKKITADQYKMILTDHLYPTVWSNGSAPIHRTQELAERFQKYENYGNHKNIAMCR